MALSVSMTAALLGVLQPGMRIASWGYPDMIAPEGLIRALAGEHYAGIVYRSDSDTICARHGLKPRLIPDAEAFFTLLGCEFDVFDIVQERGCEIICDLNKPLLARSFKEPVIEEYGYDVVLDVGTAEHCFNIGQALMNMASIVKRGGVVIHENPFNCGNHGFYSLNPTLYADFYAQNGFEVEQCGLRTKDGRGAEVPRTKRFMFTVEEVNVFAVARRVTEQRFVFPVQSKYAKLIPAAGVPGDSPKEEAHGAA